MSEKSILITGVTGFIGRYLVRQFNQTGWRVMGLGTRPLENAPSQDLRQYHQLHLPSAELAQCLRDTHIHACVHCIGRASVELSVTDPVMDFRSSVEATFNLLDVLRRQSPQCRLVFLSSAAVYGNPDTLPIVESQQVQPISPYGYHKLMCEQICAEFHRVYGLPTACVRIFSAYGPGLRRQVMWDICQKALTEPVLRLRGTGSESRDFVHALDIASAIELIVERARCESEIYNLASGQEIVIRDLAGIITRHLAPNIQVEFDNTVSPGIPKNWRANIDNLMRLGFKPNVHIEQGVAAYTRWCKAEITGH